MNRDAKQIDDCIAGNLIEKYDERIIWLTMQSIYIQADRIKRVDRSLNSFKCYAKTKNNFILKWYE